MIDDAENHVANLDGNMVLYSLTEVRCMIESGSQPAWVSVAEASRALEITETAVRKRIRAGSLPARGNRGATEVLLSVGNSPPDSSELMQAEAEWGARQEAARLAGELAEVRARLADALLERDRWYEAAVEARAEARAAAAAREAAEREVRLLLGRA